MAAKLWKAAAVAVVMLSGMAPVLAQEKETPPAARIKKGAIEQIASFF